MLPRLQEKLLSCQRVTVATRACPDACALDRGQCQSPPKAQQCKPGEPVSCTNTSTPASVGLGGRNAWSFKHTHCHPGLGQSFLFLQGLWSHWVRTHPSDFILT